MTQINAEWRTDTGAQKVCSMLTDAGHQAWFVGGCVRNALLDVPVADVDIATDAHPNTVVALAKAAKLKSIPTGIDHGTITIVADKTSYEITTFRRDVETDGRRATVAFATDITQDAARRDFTMNALYAAPDGTVTDPLGGLPDLHARRVRFIGEADERIAEDYLRILRFFRFHAIYGDQSEGVDADGLAACAAGADGLEKVSAERIGAEMRKLLGAANPAPALGAMRASGVLMRILPGSGTGLLQILLHIEDEAGLSPDPIRRLAALGGEDVAKTLRLSRAETTAYDTLRTGLEGMHTPEALGYTHGAATAHSILALRAALSERTLDSADLAAATAAARQNFPLKAADLMPELEGLALGTALKKLEAEWVASDFTLDRAALLRRAVELRG